MTSSSPEPTCFVDPTRAALPSAGFGLPPELLNKARGRLRLFALLMLCLGVLGTSLAILSVLFSEEVVRDKTGVDAIHILGIVMAAALYLAARSKRLGHTAVLRLGLVYEVGMCLAINIGVPRMLLDAFGYIPHLTFASTIIVLYPLLVPSPPRLTLVIALAAASTSPIGIFVVSRLADADMPASAYVGSSIFPFLCVIIAFFASRVVHGMNVEVARAQRLGSYVLEAHLGAGGMGEVWRAHHRMLARPAAVKLIKPESLGTAREGDALSILRRFEKEAQATAGLLSPHTVNVHDFGRADDGRFYYVMELLEGLNIQELVERHGPQPPERVAFVLRQICHSLDEAHGVGLVHRDIKPANLFLCRYGRDVDFVKVLDFGLVKQSTDESDGPELTRDGMTVGTPAFMAPEMAHSTAPDSRADIYGVGCVAYWLLTGEMVFEADSPMQVVIKHARDVPLPPSERSELEIPSAIDGLVLACLEKSPDDRPQTARALSDSLATIAFDQAWDEQRMQRWWKTHAPDRSRLPA